MNSQASALRFFLTITCGRPDLAHQLARTHYPKKLPRVLSPEDVGRLLEAVPGPGLKYKAALERCLRFAGLRGGEVVMLRVSDIDSKRMLIRVEMGKGRKDRHAMLSPQLAGTAARLVAAMPVTGLAVPGPRSAAAVDDAPAQPGLQDGGRSRRSRQLGDAAYAAALVRDAPSGEPHRCARDPGPARTCEVGHDGALRARRNQHVAHGDEPARSIEPANTRAAIRTV